jgi:mannose/fructose-specific phosphotransferase system component IIA
MNTKTEVVLVTHGDAGRDMIEAAERVVGALGVHSIGVYPADTSADVERRIERVVETLETDEVLFLVDLEGSTPFNLCCRRCGGDSVVLTGMNMPMLFKLATADRAHGARTLAEELMSTGLKSIHIRTGAA